MRAENARVISAAIGGILAGAGIGYVVASRKLSAEFETRLRDETAHMREFYEATTPQRKKYSTPEEAVRELVMPEVVEDALKNYKGNDGVVAYNKVVKEDPPTVLIDDAGLTSNLVIDQNVFETKRSEDSPYIISQEEFLENDGDFEQSTLTWYSGDEQLTDERDLLLENYADVVGVDFKVSFGEGSSDERIVHIRNEKLHMDFEVVKSDGSYAQEVMGIEETPMDSPSSRRQREV